MQFWPNVVKKKRKDILIPTHALRSSVDAGSSQPLPQCCQFVYIIVWIAECFPDLHLVQICLPQSRTVPPKQGKSDGNPPKPKGARDVLNQSEKVEIVDLLTGGMSVAEAGRR
jgi:hypothetical protein